MVLHIHLAPLHCCRRSDRDGWCHRASATLPCVNCRHVTLPNGGKLNSKLDAILRHYAGLTGLALLASPCPTIPSAMRTCSEVSMPTDCELLCKGARRGNATQGALKKNCRECMKVFETPSQATYYPIPVDNIVHFHILLPIDSCRPCPPLTVHGCCIVL
ncbi:hypothetical protein BDY17DRAFT_189476 [Neohortaea acidophila]|uniref:Uncharacterized protein n=1 Tax=Neohortaea acidophila TaxID=245834 RepID=A0A6A6PNK1_9PEZI|nr:uncharacterized protein BDY17DRAFT_189476 [Neohortaea acidophila]KAF2481485.1 hypothetical protein BDY17DRAFT_189476 [Neohortaea acidophila]